MNKSWFVLGLLLLIIFGLYMSNMYYTKYTIQTNLTGYFVSPRGSQKANGSFSDPWDLEAAFGHPEVVQPGDTIYLRGGTYTGAYESRLTGTKEAPITVRSYPGEWAIIDTGTRGDESLAFRIRGDYTHYRDFEITNSYKGLDRSGGFHISEAVQGNKFINLVIHDMASSNFLRGDNEVYGCIMYNNGKSENRGHQFYTANPYPAKGATRITNNIIFNGYAFGIHAYSEGQGWIDGIIKENIWFNAGVAAPSRNRKDDLIIAANNEVRGIVLENNLGWAHSPQERSVALGRYWDNNKDITLKDNYLMGNTVFYDWDSVQLEGNTFYSLDNEELRQPRNTYLDTRPAQNKVFIKNNKYDPDRFHIAVYNWEDLDKVSISPEVLQMGESYEVRNVQNYFTGPVAQGIYDGSLVLPMDMEIAQPIANGNIDQEEMTKRAFNVFILSINP